MKTLIPLIGIAWITLSCSTENDLIYDTQNIETEQAEPENNRNTYDLAGTIYREIMARYAGNSTESVSIAQINKEVQSLMRQYNLEETEAAYVSHKNAYRSEISLDSILANSPLSPQAGESFSLFIYTLVDGTYTNYQNWNAFILAYENDVMQQYTWPEEDRNIILTVTTLIRNIGETRHKEREDEDWDIAIGHIYSIITGVFESFQTAIVNALIYPPN